jgi:hypothetical protein
MHVACFANALCMGNGGRLYRADNKVSGDEKKITTGTAAGRWMGADYPF